MSATTGPLLVRLSPVVFLGLAAAAWFNDVQEGGPWVWRNIAPLVLIVLLATVTLWRGNGTWTGGGWSMPLGVIGFAIPALGLSSYLHFAYSVNLDGMFDGGAGELFRYLPLYNVVAGGIGYAIGWLVGRNVV